MKLTEEELYTIYCIENGVEIELMKNIASGAIREPLEKVFEKQYTVTLFLLGFSSERIRELLTRCRKIVEKVRIAESSRFQIAYTGS